MVSEGADEARKFVVRVKRGDFNKEANPCQTVVKRTVELLRAEICQDSGAPMEDILAMLRRTGKVLSEAHPFGSVLTNVTRKMMAIVREEMGEDGEKADHSDIQHHINDYLGELDEAATEISTSTKDNIHENEVILTLGNSPTVARALTTAAKKIKFEVVVAENSPQCSGHALASQLSKAGIATTLIPDCGVFAHMTRVSKVIIDTDLVLANGGLIARSGTLLLAVAANQHKVPLVVLTPLYKLSTAYHSKMMTDVGGAGEIMGGGSPSQTQVLNTKTDYVPPDLVYNFITNHGGYAPSYIYRLLAETYKTEDYDVI